VAKTSLRSISFYESTIFHAFSGTIFIFEDRFMSDSSLADNKKENTFEQALLNDIHTIFLTFNCEISLLIDYGKTKFYS